MAIKINDTKGNVSATQNLSDSELGKDALDIEVGNTGGSVTASQTVRGVKSRSQWVWAVIAICAVIGTVATAYFGTGFIQDIPMDYPPDMPQEDYGKAMEMPQRSVMEQWMDALGNWRSLTVGGIVALLGATWNWYKNRKNNNS